MEVTMTPALLSEMPHVRRGISRSDQYRIFLVALFCADLIGLTLAFMVSFIMRFESGWMLFDDPSPSRDIHLVISFGLLPLWMIVFLFSDLYNPHYLFSSTQEYKKVFNACSIAFTLIVGITFLIPVVRVSRGWAVLAWATAVLFVGVGRFLMRRFSYWLREQGLLTARTIVIGTDSEAHAIAQQLLFWRGCGAEVIGFVDNIVPIGTKIEGDVPVIGTIDALPSIVEQLDIDELIVAPSALPREDLLWIFQMFGTSNKVELRFSPGLFEIFTSGVRVKEIGSVPLVSMRKVRLDAVESALKALTDYGLAFFALLMQIPVFIIVSILIRLDSPGPIFHRRRVLGVGGKQFDALKFRTMYVNGNEILDRHPELKAELERNQKLKDDPRITRIGKYLRKYSIDELPQLINVIRGEMSIVGPRMIVTAEMEKYGKWRANLLTVKPGITGLWQISGRSDVSYADRVRLDMYYIRNYTVWSDLRIIWRTIPVVLGGKGAY
jgi:exopolysaccharide biosynthesis polyprenyl glycosylphosphotransferase